MTTTPQRIDEIRDRLNKAHPGLAEIDGGEEILKRRGNPKGVHPWTLYGPYADAILLVNAPDDLAWLLGEVERLSAERMQPEQPEPTDAEIRAAAIELEQHEQFWYGDDDQPRCECGFRLEESPNGNPIPSLQMHQARAALVAARKAARHE